MVEQKEQLEKWQDEFREHLREQFDSLRHYKLDENRNPVRCDMLEAAEWFETADRQVDITFLSGDVHVSTVFLFLDHGHFRGGPPVLFETMVFRPEGEPGDDMMTRYSTWDEAAFGHRMIVEDLCKNEHREILEGHPLDAEFIE